MKRFLYLAFTISFFSLVWISYDYYKTDTALKKQGKTLSKQACYSVINKLDSVSKIEYDNIQHLSDTLTNNLFSEEQLLKFIVEKGSKNKNLLGITVAFLPNKFLDKEGLYAPFYDLKTEKLLNITDFYDYTNPALKTSVWFTKAINSTKPILTKPYFGEAAQELVVDFAMPFYTDSIKTEKAGVVSITISLDNFTEFINSLVVGNTGYAFTYDDNGNFITHPNRDFILHKNLNTLKGNSSIKKLRKKLKKEEGFLKYKSLYTQVPSIIYYARSKITRWKVAVVFSQADISGDPKVLKQKVIQLAGVSSIFLFLSCCLVFKWYQMETKQLWLASFLISFLFVSNIAVIWLMHLDFDYSQELSNTTRVYDTNELHNYINKKDLDQRSLGHKEYLKIPTGIFIEELEVSESYDMSISGMVWQRWPANHDLKDKVGFHFIQAAPYGRSIKISLLSKDVLEDGALLYTWQFDATLKIYFDYAQYPLDQHYIDIKLIYPDLTDDIMLIPDLDSYEVLNPSAKPGLSDVLFLPKHRIIASYFSFASMDMKTFFGRDRGNGVTEYQLLEYNIVIKRRFITPFVSFIIPALLGAALIFFLLYSLTKDKDDTSGVTVMGVVQGMVGLFFSLLLAHITIRNRIASPNVTYMETFYFAVYIIIILLIVDVVMFSKNRHIKFIQYKDNLIVKLAFWPIWLGVLLIVTLIKFY
ncbi:MAG: cache domain-containing protein [Cyclobacteriaceae bacterium]|nr:cache domain-containing protein [Cyclobacteriaceae bacterium]